MDNWEKKRFRLHDAVFYRQYGETVLLYHTGKQRVLTYDGSAKEILDCFKKWTCLSDAVQNLRKAFEIEDEDNFDETVRDFVEDAVDKGILVPEFQQIKRDISFEREIPGVELNGENRLNTVTFELTYKCNEKCRHCYVVGDNRMEMSTDKILSVLDELAEMEVLNLVFTGGDIFTRKDIFEILEYAHSKGFLIEIFTNGVLLSSDDLFRLKALWPKCIDFSVYSHIPEKHDAITQVKGSFEKTINTIKKCVLLGIPVNIKSPIFIETVDDVEGLVMLANSLGVTVEPGINITPKKDGDLSPTQMRVMLKEDYWKFFETMSRVYGEEQVDEEYRPPEKICNAGESNISISPYGDVFPCNLMPVCIGNLNESSVQEIWKGSDKLKEWRRVNSRSLCKDCIKCEIRENCNFCPGDALLRTGDLHSKYESACITAKFYDDFKKRGGSV